MFTVLSRVSPVFVYFTMYFPYHVYSPCIYEYFHFVDIFNSCDIRLSLENQYQ